MYYLSKLGSVQHYRASNEHQSKILTNSVEESVLNIPNGTNIQNHPPSNHQILSIPFNKDSKIYTLEESVDIFNKAKARILSSDLNQFKQDAESFKNDHYVNPLIVDVMEISLNNLNIHEDHKELKPMEAVNQSSIPEESIVNQIISDDSIFESALKPNNHQLHPPYVPEDVIYPKDIQWFYLDSYNKEQGPFNGELMQNWYSAGYLNGELRIKRQNGEYQLLKNFCASVNTSIDPFNIPLPIIRPAVTPVNGAFNNPLNGSINDYSLLNPMLNQPYLQPMQSNLNFNQNYGFPQSSMGLNSIPTLRQVSNSTIPNASVNPALSNINSSWGLNGINDYVTPSTTSSVPPPMNPISNIAVQPTPRSPWTNSLSRVNSPFITTQSTNIQQQPESVDANNEDVYSKGSQIDHLNLNPTGTEPIVQPSVITVEPIVQPKVIKHEPIDHSKVTNAEQENIPPSSGSDLEPNSKIQQPKVVKVDFKVTRSSVVKEPATKPDESLKENKSAKGPWTNNSPETSATKVGLKEIQKLETEKAQKAKAEKAELQSQFIEQAKLLEKQKSDKDKSKVSLPTKGWGTVSQVIKPAKTLAQIQDEELQVSEMAKLKLAHSQPSLASTLAQASGNASTNTNAWTTVTKKPIKSTSAGITNINQPSKVVNTQMLRNISAPVAVVDKSNKLREEFLVWARSQMINLYPNVSCTDLLEMFISLPNNPDSLMLISETIYGSSTTMNGRVFAQDFLKKRQGVEKQVSNDLEAWKIAIVESAGKVAAFDEDGWSTTKTKKKGRKT